ncbi:alpha/beta hydrolase [Microbulbifer hainanensis]|uniref:alpha/beta hydrolase n=1 Tax=Microbulbifer hainanensis TaxID=2735675 RepID=UPI0018690B6E|nr:alpha/beta hydrolase [Microbulbifer hainanensis]
MKHLKRPSIAATALLAALCVHSVSAAPFTTDRVLEKLAGKYPGLARVDDTLPANVLARENIDYLARESEILQLDIYQPKGNGLFPAVLIIHGGGWETGDRTMERPFAKRLAARGFVAVPVSYRLGTSGRFPAAVFDLKAAVRWLRAHAHQFHIDPARIAAVGGSAGGHLAALLGASNREATLEGDGPERDFSSEVQAVVDIDGAVDFTDARIIRQEREREGAPSRFLGGDYSARRKTWLAASPLYYVGPQSAPTLFINSTAASPILPGRRAMQARLRALDIDAQLITIPDTPHPFWLVHPWFNRTLDATADFLQAKLQRAR